VYAAVGAAGGGQLQPTSSTSTLLLIILKQKPVTSVGDPDPEILTGSESGNFDQIQIRPLVGALCQSEKVIFSQQHFQYFAFKQTMTKF
jgi:hypothetical protein